MKKNILIAFCVVASLSACNELNNVVNPYPEIGSSTPSTLEIANGLKAALEKGTINGVKDLSAIGGYANHELYKIHFPPSAKKVETTLRGIGLDSEVDNVVALLNKAAENAVTEAKPIFINAIQQMTISDAKAILFGADTAATAYLEDKTRADLYSKFNPHIEKSLNEVNATKYWNQIISQYNKLPMVEPINPDLNSYVTNRAIDGLFLKISKEEKSIREDPISRTSDILKKVFNYASENK